MKYLYILYSRRRVKLGIGKLLAPRVATIDRTTRGNQRLVLAVVLPFKARQVEAWLHRRYKAYHAPLKAGSGRTEYFWLGFWTLEAVAIMLLVQVGQWAVVWGCVFLILLISLR